MLSLLSNSTRIGAVGAALVWTAASMGTLMTPSAAEARGNGPYYTAELAAPASENTVIAGGVAWTCSGTQCVAGRGTSRPLRICSQLQRDVGIIVSFTANGETLDDAKLAKCNG